MYPIPPVLKGIFVNAGHGLGPTGAIDNGASGFGTTERKEVVEVAQELCTLLMSDADLQSVEILKIGVDDRMMLKDMIREVNDICRLRGWQQTDAVLVSIHANSAGSPEARGIEAWYSSQNKPGEVNLAKALTEHVSNMTGFPLRPKPTIISAENRYGRLGILDDTLPVASLIEIGFLSNEFDARILKDSALDDAFAQGIYHALRSWMALPAVIGFAPPPDFYTDVPPLAWYADAVHACLDAGLFVMSSDGKFHPERPATRAELAAVLARHLAGQHPHS